MNSAYKTAFSNRKFDSLGSVGRIGIFQNVEICLGHHDQIVDARDTDELEGLLDRRIVCGLHEYITNMVTDY